MMDERAVPEKEDGESELNGRTAPLVKFLFFYYTPSSEARSQAKT